MTILQRINLKACTLGSLFLIAVVMMWMSRDFGISGDEVTQHTYGQKVLAYLTSSGADKSALTFKNVYFYGGLYDAFCAALEKAFPAADPYNIRHALNALMGALTIAAASLLARRLGGWGAALATAWFLALSPRFIGESMNNPKDIPFALGMTLGFSAILRFLESFPVVRWKSAVWMALAIGFAISIRIGGLLLIPYIAAGAGLYYLLRWRKTHALTHTAVLRFAGVAALSSAVGYGIGLLVWPYALQAPLSNPFTALAEMSQFSVGIRMLYDDRMIMSNEVPWYYIPKWIYITSPIVVLALFSASPALPWLDRRLPKAPVLFLLFATFFPVVYVIYKHSPLYDGWRHLLFVYPLMAVLAALVLRAVVARIEKPALKLAVVGAVVLGLCLPLRWMVANHPHDIVYFNELQGGTAGAYGYYETDYYMNSMKPAIRRLDALAGLQTATDSLTIATNCIEPVQHYLARLNPRLKPAYVRYRERHQTAYDYAIFYTRFIEKEQLQNGYFPPDNTIGTVDADGVPLAAILRGDSSRAGARAFERYNAKDYATAAALYAEAQKRAPKDETIMVPYAISLASIGRLDDAIAQMNAATKITPANPQLYQVLAQLYDAKGDRTAAQRATQQAQAILYEETEGAQ